MQLYKVRYSTRGSIYEMVIALPNDDPAETKKILIHHFKIDNPILLSIYKVDNPNVVYGSHNIIKKTDVFASFSFATAILGFIILPIVFQIGMAKVVAALQTATVLASPIPKYRTGRKGGPEELAIVGDGGVHEVIEHKDGSAEITPNRNTLVKLLEGDTVHASLDLYRKSRENKINNDLYKHQVKFDAYNSVVSNDTSKLEKLIADMHETLKKKNLSTVVNVPKYDFAHQLWVEKQRNW